MIWAVLVMLGVPLWLCAIGIFIIVFRNRQLRSRHNNIQVRVLREGHTRWTRGQAIWVSDVFAWRGDPAAWAEALMQVTSVRDRPATADEAKKLHRLGADVAIVELSGPDGETLAVAAAGANRAALHGPQTSESATTA